jgi:uncharacterized membrane protein
MRDPLASSTGLSSRVAAPLAYAAWWVTGIIFFVVERRDGFVRFHAAQAMAAFGLIAILVGMFAALAGASLSYLPSAFLPFLWIAGVTWLFGMSLWLVAMWKAASGETWRIPLAGALAERMMRRVGTTEG